MEKRSCVVWVDTNGTGGKPIPCESIEKSPMDGFIKLVNCEQVSESARPKLEIDTITIRESAIVYFAEGKEQVETPTPTLVQDEPIDDEPFEDFFDDEDEEPEPEPPKKRSRRKKK